MVMSSPTCKRKAPASSRNARQTGARGVDDAPIFFELNIVAQQIGLYSSACYTLPNISVIVRK
jgi:hypothetical protein